MGIWDLLNNIIEKIKNKRIIIWIFIILLLLILILYPIIDANFLYYERTKKRIEILDSISKINVENIAEDIRMKDEYESILTDMDIQKEKTINKIIDFECTRNDNIAKAITASWIFVLVAIIVLFTKDKDTGKLKVKNNILSSLLCLFIAIVLAWIATYIPIIINIWITCFIIQGIILYLSYTIGNNTK